MWTCVRNGICLRVYTCEKKSMLTEVVEESFLNRENEQSRWTGS